MPNSLITANWNCPPRDITADIDRIASSVSFHEPQPSIIVSPLRKREIDTAGGIDAWIAGRFPNA